MHHKVPLLFMAALLAVSCASSRRNEWNDIDYSSVYRKAGQRDNDPAYVPTASGSCVDDDLMNCN